MFYVDNRNISLIDPSQANCGRITPQSDKTVKILSYNVLLNTVWYAKSIQLPSCITNISSISFLKSKNYKISFW